MAPRSMAIAWFTHLTKPSGERQRQGSSGCGHPLGRSCPHRWLWPSSREVLSPQMGQFGLLSQLMKCTVGTTHHLLLFLFKDRVSLCSPGCAGSVEQAGLRFSETCLSSTGIKGCATSASLNALLSVITDSVIGKRLRCVGRS